MKKTLKISVLTVAVILFAALSVTVALTAYAKSGDVSITWQGVSDVYEVGESVDFSAIKLSDGSKEYETIFTVYYPDGNITKENKIVLGQFGKYRVVAKATVNGKLIEKTKEFVVKNPAYSVSGEKSSVSFGNNALVSDEIEGINLSLKNGDTFNFGKIIDLNEFTKDDKLIKFYFTPENVGSAEVTNLYVKLTDIYDENNYVLTTYKCLVSTISNLRSTYVSVGANGYAQTGLEYKSTKDGTIEYNNHNFSTHKNDIYGFRSMASATGEPAEIEDFDENYQFLAVDYKERKFYAQYCWYKTWKDANMISDLDEPLIYNDQLWNGFTTGEVYLSLYADGYVSSALNLFITEIGKQDISQTTFKDDTAPELTVDFGEYSETDVPVARIGKTYPLFDATAFDETDGFVKVSAKVYLNYYSSSKAICHVRDGGFVPTREGKYTIVYSAVDNAGNRSERCVDVEADEGLGELNIDVEYFDNSTKVAEPYKVGAYTVSNAGGNVTVAITARKADGNGEEYDIDPDTLTFIPYETGEYDIVYTVSDYTSVIERALRINVEKTDLPVIYELPELNDFYLNNCRYDLPYAYAYDYSEGQRKLIRCSAVVYADDSSVGENVEDGKITVKANDHIKVVFKATNSKGSTESEPVTARVVDIGYNEADALKAGNLFYGKDFTCKAEEEYIRYSYKGADDKARLEFVNKLLLNEFNFTFGFVDAATDYSSVTVTLTSVKDQDQKLVFTFTPKGEVINLSVNDYYQDFIVPKTSDDQIIYLSYNNNSKFASVNGSANVYLSSLKIFNGFEDNFVYLTVDFNGVGGGFDFDVRKLYMQSLTNSGDDDGEPKIFTIVANSSIGRYGEKYTLNAPIFYDLIDPNVYAYVKVVDPSGSPVKADDGTVLNGSAAADRNYTFTLNSYGQYSVKFRVSDYTENEATSSFVITVKDDIPPEAYLKGDYSTYCFAGETLKIAGVTVTDNASEYSVRKYVRNSDGVMSELTSDEYVFAKVGRYTINYFVYDAEGNTTVVSYEVNVYPKG